MSKSIDSPHELDLASLTALSGAAANEHVLQRLRSCGHPQVRISHGYVFQHLIGGHPTVGELATHLGVTQQAASKSVRELEELGYVERIEDVADSRVRRVALTSRGRAVISLARKIRTQFEEDIRNALGQRAIATAKRVLCAVLEAAGATELVTQRRVKPPSP
jgi:DNA-binding MarR family transcriptional regulator